MKRIGLKVSLILVMMLITLTSCTRREDTMINDNMENQVMEEESDRLNQEGNNQSQQSLKVVLTSISQEEYDEWVVPSYNGYLDPNGQPYQLPELEDFDYPYVEGIEDKVLQDKINETIKSAIFYESFITEPMQNVIVNGRSPWSKNDSPVLIYNKDILSIPITLYWCYRNDTYKSFSVTIDMKTGERIFLEDIINFNEDFTYKILFEEDFFNNIEILGDKERETLIEYYDEETRNEASESLLDDLRGAAEDDEMDLYYLTKDGLVLTEFANRRATVDEITIPLSNLQDFLKIESWKQSDCLQLQE